MRRLASEVRARLHFQLARRLPFDAVNLNAAAPEIADRAFCDAGIADTWSRDRAAIDGLYAGGGPGGGVNEGDRRALHALIMSCRPERVLEVGTHMGASTLPIARALQAVSVTARLTTVDIRDVNGAAAWQGHGLAMSPRDYAARLGCRDRIEFAVAASLAFMRSAEPGFDFVFLDGDHRPATVYREISAALSLLSPGGIILLHDYYPAGRPLFADGVRITGPYRAMRRILREDPRIGVQPLNALPWPTKQGSCLTTLALVTRLNSDGGARRA